MVLTTSLPALVPAWAAEPDEGLDSSGVRSSLTAEGAGESIARDTFTVSIEPEPEPEPASSPSAPATAGGDATPTSAQGALAPVQGGASPSGILADLNAQRAAAGLPPFAAQDGLMATAQQWSVMQAQSARMTHNPSFGAQTAAAGCGGATENVASAMGSISPVAAWMDSPPHRANILSGATHIGVGAATAASGVTYYTLNFASC